MNLIALLFLISGQTPNVVVELKTRATVEGHTIELGEVAVVKNADADVAATLAAIDLGYSPSPGFSRTLAAARIAESIRAAYPGLAFTTTGSQLVRVEPLTERIDAARLEEAAREALRTAAAGDRVTIELVQPIVDLSVPVGSEPPIIRASAPSGALRTGSNAVTLKVEVDGRGYATRQALFNVQRWQNVTVLSRVARSGEVITPDMVEVREVVLPAYQREKPLTSAMFVGSVAVRDIDPGKPLFDLDVHRPNAIKAQSPIVLEVRHGAIRARAMAIAMDSGSIGDRIRVQIVDSGREMHAHVESRDLVVVDLGGYDGFGER